MRQAGAPLAFRLEREMDTAFLYFDCALDGTEVVVDQRPRHTAGPQA